MMSPPQVPGAVLESSSQNPQGYGYPSKRMRLSPSSAQPPGQNDDSPTSTTASTYQETTSPADSNAALPYPAEHTIPTEQPTGVIENRLAPKTGSSSFRNVSACNRCRLRKNRCDQRLPSCSSCSKAGVRCVGYDPITKREIPRSYVYYLETRVEYLEGLLRKNGVPYDPAEVLNQSQRAVMDPVKAAQGEEWRQPKLDEENALKSARPSPTDVVQAQRQDDEKKLDKLVSNVGMISVAGASDPRYLGSTSGISFARVVFAAVKSSVSGANSDKGSTASSNRAALNSKAGSLGAGTGATSMRDSFFGLQTKPTIKPAPFPDRYLALRLVNFYFEHANPQVPILHRGEFMRMFDIVYGSENHVRTPRESYMLNIVFAIGAGIYLGDPDTEPESASGSSPAKKPAKPPSSQQRKGPGQAQPEEYHASAIVHLEACLQSTVPIDRPDGFGGGLEELQAVLLLAGFALLRPVAPGLWYIVGVAVRLAVDLGLHYEDGKDIDSGLSNGNSDGKAKLKQEAGDATRDINLKEKGRREWIRDFRRRLWWCTYSYDRLVSTCVGRPFGITDQVITTEFPSLLEDQYLTPGGFLPEGHGQPSSKHVAYHYFRFRLLQSEILQVLQHQSAQFVRASVPEHEKNRYMHAELPSPFLIKHGTFRNWRIDIDKRLWDWKESAPTKRESGVKFSHEFLELNYWQAIIMLYRQSLSVPKQFENELRADVDEVESPTQGTGVRRIEAREDEERVFLKVAEAGQKVLRLYRMLHRVHLVNYTFLATHHLFMAGISFLYAIWHSPVVRSRLVCSRLMLGSSYSRLPTDIA